VTIERTLPLTPFIDGGWYWFDVVAGPRGTTLIEAEWAVPVGAGRAPGRLSIGITTFNRPEDVVDQLRTLGEASEIHDLLDTVYVIDQGTCRAKDAPGFADAAKRLGGRLQVIEQGNLGGSGGFARSMDETLRAGRSDYLLIMDDDVQFDPEGILRAAAFADLDAGRRSSAGTCSACTTGRCCTRSPRPSRPTPGGGGPRRTPRPGTISGAGTCGTPRGCTAAPTPTTTAGGCA
jgi:hypothetical protein